VVTQGPHPDADGDFVIFCKVGFPGEVDRPQGTSCAR
jgi:hypothetical protein